MIEGVRECEVLMRHKYFYIFNPFYTNLIVNILKLDYTKKFIRNITILIRNVDKSEMYQKKERQMIQLCQQYVG